MDFDLWVSGYRGGQAKSDGFVLFFCFYFCFCFVCLLFFFVFLLVFFGGGGGGSLALYGTFWGGWLLVGWFFDFFD